MSILDRAKRETVDFDPSAKQHREWVHIAMRYNTWGIIPVRFRTQGITDMETYVRKQLLDYYIAKEFN